MVASAAGRMVQIWALTGKELITLGHPSEVLDVVFTPDTKTLAVSYRFGPIKLWNVPAVTKTK